MIIFLFLVVLAIMLLFILMKSKNNNNMYLNIITDVYINSENNIIQESHVRYNKESGKYEFLIRTRYDDFWEPAGSQYLMQFNDPNLSYNIDLQEYEGNVFINKKIVKKYINIKENFNKKQNFIINKYVEK